MGPTLLKIDAADIESVDLLEDRPGDSECTIRVRGPQGMVYIYRVTGTLNSTFEVKPDAPITPQPSPH